MITQPAAAGVQVVGVFFLFVGGGMLIDVALAGPSSWFAGSVWLGVGLWLVRVGARGQRARIAKRDDDHTVHVQVFPPEAATGDNTSGEYPRDLSAKARKRIHDAAREASRRGSGAAGRGRKG